MLHPAAWFDAAIAVLGHQRHLVPCFRSHSSVAGLGCHIGVLDVARHPSSMRRMVWRPAEIGCKIRVPARFPLSRALKPASAPVSPIVAIGLPLFQMMQGLVGQRRCGFPSPQ